MDVFLIYSGVVGVMLLLTGVNWSSVLGSVGAGMGVCWAMYNGGAFQ
jgi:hypothetical protein